MRIIVTGENPINDAGVAVGRRKVDGGNSYPHTGIIPLSIPAA